ncbi:hypothetical protein BCR36DRAFT_105683 [Piromyces finnis]|uniref:Uncharacterized protein n=1 Tax=Piromyces finnis TaxID=1754191 RepID=A0A1Y1V3F2_9FUNG|nr:hypothetical protein BCR36DRAFT_105683 [Piromyces finnis]|eukprot:ORX46223.1 hypothetical protein BCR36DRAFT_105683 [Piromyces finnis]
MINNKIQEQEHVNFNFNSFERKRKQPDSKVLPESVVALLSVTQQYHQNIDNLEQELEDIKKEEAQIHETFRRRLLQNQKRLKEFQSTELIKRKNFDQEYEKNIEDLHKKYKNQLEDKTVCKKCYNQVVSSYQICIGCQIPVCNNCQENPISWGCCHFNTIEKSHLHMDIDKNENNKKLTFMNNTHDTQVDHSVICCKDCIPLLLSKRCEKCFKRLCQNESHTICTICSNNNSNKKNRMILLCNTCQEAVKQYQNYLYNNDTNEVPPKYTYISNDFLFNECSNPSCHVRLCNLCTEKEGASCHKCHRIYCNYCQKKNNFIRIIMEDGQHSYWECISCQKESQIKEKNKNLNLEIIKNNNNNNGDNNNNNNNNSNKNKDNDNDNNNNSNNNNDKDCNNNNNDIDIKKGKQDVMNMDDNIIHSISPKEKQISRQKEFPDSTNDSNIAIEESKTKDIANTDTNINDIENHTTNIGLPSVNSTTTISSTNNIDNINKEIEINDDKSSFPTLNNTIEKNKKSADELIFFSEKENIPLKKNNTKNMVKEIEGLLNSQSRHKYYNKIMKIRPEFKYYQKEGSHSRNNINENPIKINEESFSNKQTYLDKTNNKTDNVTIKPLEKALSHVSLE